MSKPLEPDNCPSAPKLPIFLLPSVPELESNVDEARLTAPALGSSKSSTATTPPIIAGLNSHPLWQGPKSVSPGTHALTVAERRFVDKYEPQCSRKGSTGETVKPMVSLLFDKAAEEDFQVLKSPAGVSPSAILTSPQVDKMPAFPVTSPYRHSPLATSPTSGNACNSSPDASLKVPQLTGKQKNGGKGALNGGNARSPRVRSFGVNCAERAVLLPVEGSLDLLLLSFPLFRILAE